MFYDAPAYPRLMSPLEVDGLTLPNRIIMGSMHLGLEEAPGGFERMAVFYAERARGGVGLMVTGGFSPNDAGALVEHGAVVRSGADVAKHRLITGAVHEARGRIVLQLLHAGRYAKHSSPVAPSPLPTPINPVEPRELSEEEIEQTIADFARAAEIAVEAGYDGVEVMGSEGYLINQFTAAQSNQRDDEWGGSATQRHRFAIGVVRAVRAALGPEPLLLYRISVIDLVPEGATGDETVELARAIEQAGASIITTGVGWHESRVPTIATMVPRAAFAEATERVAAAVSVPVAASNRINDPETAERILAGGRTALVAMARPFLADPEFVAKARAGQADRINTCIACNQACLDHAFTGRLTSCLVNPRAGHETLLPDPRVRPASTPKRIAVVGAGPAGLAAATTAATRGHHVTLFDQADRVGGQFDLARRIPGKEDYAETIRYFGGEIDELAARGRLDLRLGTRVTVSDLAQTSTPFDEIVLATGIVPRRPAISGIEHPSVVGYVELLRGEVVPGDDVAIIGAGGIGFDVAAYLAHEHAVAETDVIRSPDESRANRNAFFTEWGVDPGFSSPGALTRPRPAKSPRRITLVQRKASRVGAGLGPTTGWIHRAELQMRGVQVVAGAAYDRIDDAGLHLTVDGQQRLIAASTIVVCAGQEPNRALDAELRALGLTPHLIGGADVAAELDAKRAILQATLLANDL